MAAVCTLLCPDFNFRLQTHFNERHVAGPAATQGLNRKQNFLLHLKLPSNPLPPACWRQRVHRKPHVTTCFQAPTRARVRRYNRLHATFVQRHIIPIFVPKKLQRLYLGTSHPTRAVLTADAPRSCFRPPRGGFLATLQPSLPSSFSLISLSPLSD